MKCESLDIKVFSVTCDDVYVKYSSLEMLGCDLAQQFYNIRYKLNVTLMDLIFTLHLVYILYTQLFVTI